MGAPGVGAYIYQPRRHESLPYDVVVKLGVLNVGARLGDSTDRPDGGGSKVRVIQNNSSR